MNQFIKFAAALFFISFVTPIYATSQDSPASMHELGTKHYKGIVDGKPDLKKAIELWQKSAEAGYAPAQFDMGVMYKSGFVDGKENPKAAFDLYEKAASAGFGPAIVNLGIAYAKGEGTEPDLIKALKLFQDALKLYNDPKSQYPDREIVIEQLQQMIKTVEEALKG